MAEIAVYVQYGRADIAITNALAAKNYFDQQSQAGPPIELVFRQPALFNQPNGIMIQKNQAQLAQWLDKEFREVRDDAEVQTLEQQILRDFEAVIETL
jgi:ABC-type amino acid transport substrate-binding protein